MKIHLLKVHHDINKKNTRAQIEKFGERKVETAVNEEGQEVVDTINLLSYENN